MVNIYKLTILLSLISVVSSVLVFDCNLVGSVPTCQARDSAVPRKAILVVDGPLIIGLGRTFTTNPECVDRCRIVRVKACGQLCEGNCIDDAPACSTASGCKRDTCQCKRGFVRHLGKCILPNTCPNKLWQCHPFGVVCVPCPFTGCTRSLTPYDSKFKCQSQTTCQIRCLHKHEQFRTCGTCEATCFNPNPGPTCALVGCIWDVCQCGPGFVKHAGRCIPPNDCPPAKACLDSNEEFLTCGKPCEPTCRVPNPTGLKCQLPKNACINTKVCQCKPGFYRHKTGFCVEMNRCYFG